MKQGNLSPEPINQGIMVQYLTYIAGIKIKCRVWPCTLNDIDLATDI